jgi:hypothetical protein
MIQFAESKSHYVNINTQIGFAGLMEGDGQIMDVQNVYLESGKLISVTESNCKFFFKNKHMSGIFCGVKIDDGGRRTVASIVFKTNPGQ